MIELNPVGYVVEENVIEILPEYEDALKDIEISTYMWILYIFHLAEEKLLVHPRGDKTRPLRGVFTTRTQNRPNRIGQCVVKFIKTEGRRLHVRGLDALPGSPVVDIKPYAEVFDLPYGSSFTRVRNFLNFVQGSVLNIEEIEKRIVYEDMISDYIDLKTQLQPNGFDCTLRSVVVLKGAGKIDFDNRERKLPDVEEIPFEDDWVFLEKGVYRAFLNEVVNLDRNLMAFGRPRSTLARAGVGLITAVWDAGYRGRSEVGLVVYNPNGVWLKKNARIIQLVFVKLVDETKPYLGAYQGENI